MSIVDSFFDGSLLLLVAK